ncbi:endonuclease/exonuclease/phosphatase family protein [Streptomyces sp. DI166]|uniref:endonuclease/exonuclease/phosphatase family protein n=1 Tax=Streptomyces sp. DI166 TaxID=1839783 RepID=UPI000B832D25|nr:endonuclease/exonuclease/phosphatase family protein [Streptomyces sp. DI166]
MLFARGAWLLVVAVIAGCAVLVGPSAPGGASDQSRAAARDAVPNRVMTWNLCNPCDESNVDRAAEIARYAPQVIAVQEACQNDVARIREYLENLHGLKYHVEYGTVLRKWSRCGGAPWNPGAYGQALLAAAPMTDFEKVEYADGGSEDRGYMAVTTRVDGRAVRVFNTHLAERRQEEIRADQADALAKVVARHKRTIVLGDFNAVPDAPELSPMWALAEDADPQCHPAPELDCEPTTEWQSKFDYIFLRGYAPLTHHVRQSAYSDHYVVYADLKAK